MRNCRSYSQEQSQAKALCDQPNFLRWLTTHTQNFLFCYDPNLSFIYRTSELNSRCNLDAYVATTHPSLSSCSTLLVSPSCFSLVSSPQATSGATSPKPKWKVLSSPTSLASGKTKKPPSVVSLTTWQPLQASLTCSEILSTLSSIVCLCWRLALSSPRCGLMWLAQHPEMCAANSQSKRWQLRVVCARTLWSATYHVTSTQPLLSVVSALVLFASLRTAWAQSALALVLCWLWQ